MAATAGAGMMVELSDTSFKEHIMRGFLSVLVMVMVSVGFLSGCSSGGDKGGSSMSEGKKAVESFDKTKAAIAGAQKQVDETLVSLNKMSSGQDLANTNKKFNSEVADLKKSGEAAKKRYNEMQSKQQAFVQKWQAEMSKLSDPNLKSTLEQRKDAVAANFNKVKTAAQGVRDAYQPFMAQLGEIQKTLAIDLTPATVQGIKPTIDKATAAGQVLKQKLAAAQSELNAIQAGLASQVPKGK
jgi:hypothetical protein